MDVIIDGYNVIGSEEGLRGPLEHKRKWLIQQVARYQKITGFTMTLVFDGWKSGALETVQEKIDGVKVLYSRQGEKADPVIVRLARQSGNGCVVISSDREIRADVEKFGATAIYAGEFKQILRHLDEPGYQEEVAEFEIQSPSHRSPHRLSKAERRRQEKLKKLRLQ